MKAFYFYLKFRLISLIIDIFLTIFRFLQAKCKFMQYKLMKSEKLKNDWFHSSFLTVPRRFP